MLRSEKKNDFFDDEMISDSNALTVFHVFALRNYTDNNVKYVFYEFKRKNLANWMKNVIIQFDIKSVSMI